MMETHNWLAASEPFRFHRPDFLRYSYDKTKRGNVTDERDTQLAGGAIRGGASSPAGDGLPHARLAHRGGGCRPGGMAESEPFRHEHRLEPGRVADNGGSASLPQHAAR